MQNLKQREKLRPFYPYAKKKFERNWLIGTNAQNRGNELEKLFQSFQIT